MTNLTFLIILAIGFILFIAGIFIMIVFYSTVDLSSNNKLFSYSGRSISIFMIIFGFFMIMIGVIKKQNKLHEK